uniref:Uncharacterized protein n=1 Tax=Rhizophora mucronata TaxID=61149 RepID=A0A2P2J396_RHIMU
MQEFTRQYQDGCRRVVGLELSSPL